MSFIDNLVDIFLEGPDNWNARTLDTISFISPEGDEYIAKWRGGERRFDKKVGIFAFPNIRGNIVQDLEANSDQYPITFYFDGKDSDLFGKAFFQSAKQNGRWTVTHPVYGLHELQLLSLKQTDEPVTNGGIVTFESEWIEPIDESTLLTAAEAAGLVEIDIDNLNDSAFSEFTDQLDSSTEALKNSIDTVVNGVSNVTDFYLGPLFSTVDALDNAMSLINNGIQDLLAASVLDVLSLGGQLQSLIQTPALATTSLSTTLEYYDDLATSLVSSLPDTTGRLSRADRNHILVTELALNSVVSAQSKATVLAVRRSQAAQQASLVASAAAEAAATATTSTTAAALTATGEVIEATPLETRAQAVEAAQAVVASFREYVEALEEKQEDFETEDVDNQYFSQSQSYPTAARLVARSAQFLLISSFDLKVERRFVLVRPRSPIDIAAVEYGGLGNNDENLDLFIRSNNLTGNQIYMLPAGAEVVIFG